MTNDPSPYPIEINDIQAWGKQHAVPEHEARQRFASYVVLACIAADSTLSPALAFKGGNALRFVYGSPRSTRDLDFTVNTPNIADSDVELRKLLDQALGYSFSRFDVKTKCQRVKRNPKSVKATMPTYDITIGYQFREDHYFHDFDSRNHSTIIELEISFNDWRIQWQSATPCSKKATWRVSL
jgi:hypothetical protein